ncbi:MAG TPA: hypothetical protein GX696_06795, partial [Pseudomonadaceae bacterium]|nr:hypothetical protein [Pseudomonadaceae bacterium]
MQKIRLMLAALAVVLLAVPAAAHHSTANFNFDEAVRETISGVVTYWSFSNPHSFIDMDVTAADGSVN